MYHEEKMVNGVWRYRHASNGAWHQYDLGMLFTKYVERRKEVDELRAETAELRERATRQGVWWT